MHTRDRVAPACPAPSLTTVPHRGLLARGLALALLVLSLSSCDLMQTKPQAPPPAPPKPVVHTHQDTLSASYQAYAQGRYAEALATLDGVLDDPVSTPGARRSAYLATAMIRAGGDAKVRDAAAARTALKNAEALGDTAGDDAASSYLANAIGQVLEAREQSDRLAVQVRRLTRQKARLATRNAQLAAEQQKLKDALEKLKRLSLGN